MVIKLKPDDNLSTSVRPVNNLAYIFYYFQGIKPKLQTKLKTIGLKNSEQAFIGLRNLVVRDLLTGKLKSSDLNEANLAQRVKDLCLNKRSLEAKISRFNMDQLIPKDKVVESIDRNADQLAITINHRDQLAKIFKAPTLFQGATSINDSNADLDQALALLRLLERRRFSEAFDFPLHKVPQRFKEAADKKWPTYIGRARTAGELELLGFSRDDISIAMRVTKRTLSNLLIDFRNSFSLPADRFTYKPGPAKGSPPEQEAKFLRDRGKFLEIERQEKLIGIDASLMSRDRLLASLFRVDELYGNDSILKKHKLKEDELFKIVSNLIEELKQGVYYASMRVLQEHLKGYSSSAIADKLAITPSTVNRDLGNAINVLREYLDKYFNNKPPKIKGLDLDRFKWITMDESYQRSLKLYLKGWDTKAISKEVYGNDEHEMTSVFYGIRKRFGWTLEKFIEATTACRCNKFKAIKTDSPTFKKNVLKMVYPETLPQALAVADRASWEKKLYKQIMVLAECSEFNADVLEQFKLRAQGLPFPEIESMTGAGDSSQEVHGMIVKIRTRLDHEFIEPYLFDYAGRMKLSRTQTPLPEASCVFAKNLDYKEGRLYVYPYLRGILAADIARSYGKKLTDIEPILEAGLAKVKTKQSDYDHVTAMLPGLTVDPVKFNKLTEQEISELKKLSPTEGLRRAARKLEISVTSLRVAFAQMQKLAEGKPDLLTLAQWLDLKPGVERAVAREYYDKGSIDAGRIAGRIKQSGAITSELEVQLILNRFMRN